MKMCKTGICFVLTWGLLMGLWDAAAEARTGKIFTITATALAEWMPKIAYNSTDDEFLVTWYAQGLRVENGPNLSSVHGQRISPAGDLLGQQFQPVDYLDTPIIMLPTPAYNPFLNNYMVTYNQNRDITGNDMLATIISSTGTITAGPIEVCALAYSQMHPTIAFNSVRREYLIAWNDNRFGTGRPDIYAAILSENGTIVKEPFVVCDAPGDQYNPWACYNPNDDTYLLNWEDFRHVRDWTYNGDIYGCLLDGDGTMLKKDIAMRDDNDTNDEGDQRHNVIIHNPDANEFFVAWTDILRPSLDNGAAVGRIYKSDGTPRGEDFVICDKPGIQIFPHVAYHPGRQQYFAIWEDGRNNEDVDAPWREFANLDIYGRWLDAAGAPAGREFVFCKKEGVQRYSKIGYSEQSDAFLIAWQDIVTEVEWSDDGQQHVREDGGNIMGVIYSPAPCPAAAVLGRGSPQLETLRRFRDGVLAQSAAGKMLIGIYYSQADTVTGLLERSPVARTWCGKALKALVPVLEKFL